MKTQVGTTQGKGRVTAQILPISGELIVNIISPLQDMAGAALDAHSAHVLGTALIRMAEKLDADHGSRTPQKCGVRCHGDACAAGQLPCQSPAACGVTA